MIEFVPECNGDTFLVEFMGVPMRYISHANSISKVAKSMTNQQANWNKKIIGVVDNDKKNTPTYFDRFEMVESFKNLQLKKVNDHNHYLIVLNPELEEWLLECAKESQINPLDYNLPNIPKELHKVVQKMDVRKNQDYRNFKQAIKNAQNPSFEKLKEWLSSLTNFPI